MFVCSAISAILSVKHTTNLSTDLLHYMKCISCRLRGPVNNNNKLFKDLYHLKFKATYMLGNRLNKFIVIVETKNCVKKNGLLFSMC